MDLRQASCLCAQAVKLHAEKVKLKEDWSIPDFVHSTDPFSEEEECVPETWGSAALEFYRQARVQALFGLWKKNPTDTVGKEYFLRAEGDSYLSEPWFQWTSCLSAEERQPFQDLVASFQRSSGEVSSSKPPRPSLPRT